jgi:hypothetical protein
LAAGGDELVGVVHGGWRDTGRESREVEEVPLEVRQALDLLGRHVGADLRRARRFRGRRGSDGNGGDLRCASCIDTSTVIVWPMPTVTVRVCGEKPMRRTVSS